MRFTKLPNLLTIVAGVLAIATLGLQAQGVPAPSGKLVLHIGANAVGFGSVRLGQSSAPQTITLQNVGNAPMSVDAAAVAGAHPGDFSLVSTCGGLAIGGLCTMTFTFTPAASGSRSAMLYLTASTPTAPYMLPLVGLGIDANTPQPSFGPIDPRTGFPMYYSDGYNTLELCLDYTPPNDANGNPQPQTIDPLTGLLTPTMCLAPVPDPARPPAITDSAATTNFGAEAFWWSAEALATPTGWTRALLVLAQEAAFTGEAAVAGQQWAFGRLRIRADGVPAGTYRFTHPFGVDEHTVTAGDGRIFDTSDIGCFNTPCDFSLALNSRVSRFLQCVNAPIVINGVEYLGDPGVACQVTGSPLNQNFFRIERVEAGGGTTLLAQTDLFAVSGKRVTPIAPPPPTNQAPDAVDDAAFTAFNTPININVLGNDTDPNLPDDTLTVTSATQPVNGTATIGAGGTVTYAPIGTFSGVDSFQYTITDTGGLADTATVTVTVAAAPPANQDPIAVNDSAATPFNTPVTVNVLVNDSDPDAGDVLTVSAVSNAVNGTAAPTAGNTAVIFTPTAGFSGAGSFTYAISDGRGGSASANVTVSVGPAPNTNPVATADTAVGLNGVPVIINVLANDSDPDGDPLTVGAALASVIGGAAVRNADNTVTFTPNLAFAGPGSFTYTIADGRGGSASAGVTVVMLNRLPVAGADTAVTTAGVAVVITNLLANDSDPDGDPLSVVGLVQGTGGTATLGANNAVTFAPAAGFTGNATFTYTLGDGRGGLASGNVTVTVNPASPSPSGLVLALNFNEATGTQVLDRSGLATPNNGTMNAGVSRVAGRSANAGGALQFNGTTGMVTIADAASLDLTAAATMSAWVRSTTAGGWRSLILKERGTTALSYALYGNDPGVSGPAGYFFLGGLDRSVAGPGALPLNTWTHLVATYGDGFMRLYVNGVQVSQVARTGSLTPSANPLRLGGNAVWGEFFAGQLDDVRIFNRVLSVTEIQADMNTPIP